MQKAEGVRPAGLDGRYTLDEARGPVRPTSGLSPGIWSLRNLGSPPLSMAKDFSIWVPSVRTGKSDSFAASSSFNLSAQPRLATKISKVGSYAADNTRDDGRKGIEIGN